MAAPMESAIESYVQGFNDSAAKTVSQGILDKQLSLLSFIENLGVFLTTGSTDTGIRARTTKLIADVLHSLPTTYLSQSEVSLLSTFLCEKLADHHSIHAHALLGLLALARCANLSEDNIGMICRTIFREVHTQSLPQGDRRIVFELLLYLLTNRLQDVQKVGGDFVYGFMQAMDSEKDPRNLILAFDCAFLVMQNFSLGVFVEEIFEVVSCYFPIDFTPSANDPSGIKKEDLIICLRRCMAATPKFAQYCLPLLMEKLTSDLKSAKIDALETLVECTKTYNTESVNEFQSSFFNCIKKEVFLSGDVTIENAALDALQALVKALSSGISQSDKKKSLDGFVEEILHESKNHLLQPELMLMLSSGRLLQAAARGSDTACSQIIKSVMPMLIETYNKQNQATPRYNVMVVINGFLECTGNFMYNTKNPNPALSTYKDPILMIHVGGLHSDVPSLSIQAIKGFHTLLTLPSDCLLDTERSFIASKLVHVVVNAAVEQEIRNEATETLKFIITSYPDTGDKYVLPVIFSSINNEPMETDVGQRISQTQGLEVLSNVTCDPRTVISVTDQLFPLLHKKESLDCYQALTKCLSKICQKCSKNKDAINCLAKGVNTIHKLVEEKSSHSDWSEVLSNQIVLDNLSSYIRHVACHWTTEIRTNIQTLFIETFMRNKTVNDFAPMQNVRDAQFVCLLTPVICSDSPNTVIPNQGELIDNLCDLLNQSMNESVHQSVCKCLAGILNKLPADEYLNTVLSKLKTQLYTVSDDGKLTPGQQIKSLAWVTKALVIRNHPTGTEMSAMLFNYLSSEVFGRDAAQGFHIILSECEDVLNKTMHANIKMMYRQRFFQENLQKVITGYQEANHDTKQNYLMCLSYMIKDLTRHVLVPELPKIYPLLIQSLMCSDLDLHLTTMATLSDLIENSPEIVDKQLDSLLPQLLKLTRYQPYMKVRISALDCLLKLAKLPSHIIMPHLKPVTRALTPVLDDKKRLVRAKAAETRLEWFLLETDNK